MATTLPEKLYITFQYRKNANNESGLLGFASPYTKDAAFEKRKTTQDRWAYRDQGTVIIEDDTATITGENAAAIFIANCGPRIIENELLEGFEIAKNVRRCGWSGSGNVTWRITDPRGFDLEITSTNFASLVANTTMINGLIQGKCLWGREGSQNILLTENSEPYQAAIAHTKRASTKVSLKEVKIGDLVDFIHRDVAPNQLPAMYLGKFHAYFNKAIGDMDEYHYGLSAKQDYWFKGNDGKYFYIASLKLSSIVKAIDTPLDQNCVEDEINAYLQTGTLSSFITTPNFVRVQKLDKELSFRKEEFTGEKLSNGHWPTIAYSYARFKLAEYNGKQYTLHNGQRGNVKAIELYEIKPFDGTIKYLVTFSTPSGYNYWGSRKVETVSKVEVTEEMLDQIKLFDLYVEADGKSYKIQRWGV